MDRELEKNIIQRLAIGDIFRRSAARTPDKIALIERRDGKDIRVSYKELNNDLNRFVRAMRKLGLKKGDRIACLGMNSVEFAIVLYGTPKGAFTFVPINFFLQPDNITYILNDAEVKVLIFDDAFLPTVLKVQEGKPTTIQHYVCMPITGAEIPPSSGILNFQEIVKAEQAQEIDDVVIWERDIAEISYTSGATAAPKAVMISHMATCIPAMQTLIEMAPHLNRDTITGVMLPIFHCGARTFVTSGLLVGDTNVLFRWFDVTQVLETIQREKISLLGGLPMMWRAIFFHPDCDKYDTSSIVSGIYGMAPMDESTQTLLADKKGIALYLNSGQTEFFPPTNYCKPYWQLKKRGNYWGTPGLMVDGGIMDEEGNILPPGQIGEIVWRGPACMEGYWNNPEATNKSRKFGWHHSEDIGFIDEDGLLKFVDRKKDIIKTGGENVSSIKVEEAVLSDLRVRAAAVIGLPHERWGEAVTVFVIPQSAGELNEADVIALCRQKLGAMEVPKKVVFLDALPTTATGKIKKMDLRRQYGDLYLK